MDIPGFTAASTLAAPRGHYGNAARAAGAGDAGGAGGSRLALDSTCGDCVCAEGQCCKVGAGGGCSCYRCGGHAGGYETEY